MNVVDALLGIGLGALFILLVCTSDHPEITRRVKQAGDLLAAVGPCFVAAALTWACRGRPPGPAHPAARAIQGCPGCDACTADLDPVAFARWERQMHERRPS